MNNTVNANHTKLKGHSVLIIDDDPFTLRALSDYLERIGLETLVARDGRSGLEKACYARPDLILLDVRLPGIDGFEICSCLKAEDATSDIPVIFMTALSQTEHKIKGFMAGGVDYITKPLQFEEVLARVATHMQLDDLRQSLKRQVRDRTAQLTSANQKLQQEIAQHERTSAALKESEARYRCLFEESPISLWEEDFSKVRNYFNDLRASGTTDFRNYFDTHPDAVAHCAALVKVVDVNKATLESMEADNKAPLKQGLADLFTEQSLAVFKEELVTLAHGGVQFQSEAVHRTLSGAVTHVILCLRVAPGYEDSLEKIMISLLDITDRKKAEEKLARQKKYLEKQTKKLVRAKEEAQAANQAKARFLTKISHEFRTPLNPIIGFAQLLKRQPNLTPDQHDQIEDIQASGEHLLALIEDIINFCEQDDLPTKLPADEVDLAQMLEALKTKWADKAAQKSLSFNYEESGAIPKHVRGHQGKLEQVLDKLLHNAVKFTCQGSITLRVLSADTQAEQADQSDRPGACPLEFQVADTGCGISEDKLATIFDSFTQAPPESQLTEGMGLGLAICYQLVKQMNGRIAVKSHPGEGSLFMVAFNF